MPKVAALTPPKIAKVLEKKGFVLDMTSSIRRIYYNSEAKCRVVVTFHKKISQRVPPLPF